MAQIFVKRSELLSESADTPVRVVAAYNDTPAKSLDLHGTDCTIMLVAENYIIADREKFVRTLDLTWRDNYLPVINAEAGRRINLAFPQYKQMNYNAEFNGYQAQYGTDVANWPQEAQYFKAEYDRGWQYVNDVRTTANSFAAMPADPTADEIWPPQIIPIK